MPALSEYVNVYDAALSVLEEKGFQFWFDEKNDRYYAEKNGWDFAADTPCGLLGVIAIFEQRQPSRWQRLTGG